MKYLSSRIGLDLGVGGALCRLGKLLMILTSHVSSELNQDSLHCHFSLPVPKARQLGWVNHAISWVDTRKVDLGDELDSGWFVGVLITAVHLERIDPILVDAVWGTKNCTVPVRHHQIVSLS